jgi:hypothetical protein
MPVQLALISDDEPDWRLDEHTVEVGRRGIAAAREVLRHHHRRPDDTPVRPPRAA